MSPKIGLKIFFLLALILVCAPATGLPAKEGLEAAGHLDGPGSLDASGLSAANESFQAALSSLEISDLSLEEAKAELAQPQGLLSLKVQSQDDGYDMSGSEKNEAYLNGLYLSEADYLVNLIILDVGISVMKKGNYSVNGSLYDVVTGDVVLVSNRSFLNSGAQFMPMYLAGMKSPGPYRVKVLVLYDDDGDEIDRSTDSYTTKAYADLDLRSTSAMLDRNYSDYGSDIDHDAFYEYLTVDVGVQVIDPGNYSMMGSLYSADDKEIIWSASYANFSAGSNVMHLDFDGKTIERMKANGPYHLKDLSLFKQYPGSARLAGTTVDDLSLQDARIEAYVTGNYSYSQFKDPSWMGQTLSGKGSGEVLLTILVKDMIPVFGGRYSLDIVGANMPPISSNWTVSAINLGYAYHLPGVYMPEKPNDFTVKAAGVKDLNIGVKQDRSGMPQMAGTIQNRAWISSRASANQAGVAYLKSNFISPGRYQFKVFGDAADNVSAVGLEIEIVKKLVIDGEFELDINTTGFPSGNYSFSARALNGSLSLDQISFGDGN